VKVAHTRACLKLIGRRPRAVATLQLY